MTIVCHSRNFIFLRTKKTAGTTVETWLASHLDPDVDLIKLDTGHDELYPDLWRTFNSPRVQIKLAANSALRLAPVFRLHMPAREVRRFVGAGAWQTYRKIAIVRNPWDRVISAWRWWGRSKDTPPTLGQFVGQLEQAEKLARKPGLPSKKIRRRVKFDNWPYYAIDDDIVVDDVIRFESLEANARQTFAGLGISGGAFTREKSGYRKSSDTPTLLTAELTDRIGKLYRHEIEAFDYSPP
jgi:hypothetical protein